MRCLSVRQPWAWALVEGVKRVENRTWQTAYRGPILIHAGVSKTDLWGTTPSDWQSRGMPTLASFAQVAYQGFVLGAVTLEDVRPVGSMFEFAESHAGQSHFVEGPFCWVVSGAIKFDRPIPLRGMLGLYSVPDDLSDEVRRVAEASGSESNRHFPAGGRAC